MITLIKHSKTSIIFFSIITFLGLITGYKFYTYQEQETKTKIIETLNIEENLSYKTNNILKDLKDIFIILISSILIIPTIINIFNIFYKSFQIGFLFNILNNISTKLSLTYLTIYKIIPFIFLTLLTIKGIKISYNILKYLITKNKEITNSILRILKQFIVLSSILIIYEFILFLYSEIINKYLITLLNIMWYN